MRGDGKHPDGILRRRQESGRIGVRMLREEALSNQLADDVGGRVGE
jgi:hypothetical protein